MPEATQQVLIDQFDISDEESEGEDMCEHQCDILLAIEKVQRVPKRLWKHAVHSKIITCIFYPEDVSALIN